jgi:hypothetical protein
VRKKWKPADRTVTRLLQGLQFAVRAQDKKFEQFIWRHLAEHLVTLPSPDRNKVSGGKRMRSSTHVGR